MIHADIPRGSESASGQTANSRLVRVEAFHPSISDMMLQRREGRNGRNASLRGLACDSGQSSRAP